MEQNAEGKFQNTDSREKVRVGATGDGGRIQTSKFQCPSWMFKKSTEKNTERREENTGGS